MSDNEKCLNSELPVEKLIALSKSLAEARYQKSYFAMKSRSIWLNPVPPRGTSLTSTILDFAGIKDLYRRYSDVSTTQNEFNQHEKIPNGIIANFEFKLRTRWQQHEYLNRRLGRPIDSLPAGNQADDIAELAARLKVLKEEAVKIAKIIKEHESKEVAYTKAHRPRLGGIKRNLNGHIWQVDQMAVNEQGIIDELQIPVSEYLDQIKAEKERKREARNAALKAAA